MGFEGTVSYDEFGIPIKSKAEEVAVDEFGIPIKKKEETEVSKSPSQDGESEFTEPETGVDEYGNEVSLRPGSEEQKPFYALDEEKYRAEKDSEEEEVEPTGPTGPTGATGADGAYQDEGAYGVAVTPTGAAVDLDQPYYREQDKIRREVASNQSVFGIDKPDEDLRNYTAIPLPVDVESNEDVKGYLSSQVGDVQNLVNRALLNPQEYGYPERLSSASEEDIQTLVNEMWKFSSPKFESSSVSGQTPYGVSVETETQPLPLDSQGDNFINLDESYFRNVARKAIDDYTSLFEANRNNEILEESVRYYYDNGYAPEAIMGSLYRDLSLQDVEKMPQEERDLYDNVVELKNISEQLNSSSKQSTKNAGLQTRYNDLLLKNKSLRNTIGKDRKPLYNMLTGEPVDKLDGNSMNLSFAIEDAKEKLTYEDNIEDLYIKASLASNENISYGLKTKKDIKIPLSDIDSRAAINYLESKGYKRKSAGYRVVGFDQVSLSDVANFSVRGSINEELSEEAERWLDRNTDLMVDRIAARDMSLLNLDPGKYRKEQITLPILGDIYPTRMAEVIGEEVLPKGMTEEIGLSDVKLVDSAIRQLKNSGISLTEKQEENAERTFGLEVQEGVSAFAPMLVELAVLNKAAGALKVASGLDKVLKAYKAGNKFQRGTAILADAIIEEGTMQVAGLQPGAGASFSIMGNRLRKYGLDKFPLKFKGEFARINKLADSVWSNSMTGAVTMEFASNVEAAIEDIMGGETMQNHFEQNYSDLSEVGKRGLVNAFVFNIIGGRGLVGKGKSGFRIRRMEEARDELQRKGHNSEAKELTNYINQYYAGKPGKSQNLSYNDMKLFVDNMPENESQTFTVSSLEEVPEEFRDRVKRELEVEREVDRTFLGIPLGKKTTKEGIAYSYEVTGKEMREYLSKTQGEKTDSEFKDDFNKSEREVMRRESVEKEPTAEPKPEPPKEQKDDTKTTEQKLVEAGEQVREEPGRVQEPESGREEGETSDVLQKQEEVDIEGVEGKKVTISEDHPIDELNLDPDRFQYKVEGLEETGATGSLKGVRQFNKELAGVVLAWKDPADGKTYVVNGHNRVNLAKQTGTDVIDIRYIEADNAQEARALGALTNIAEGKGTALDAAKYFRDTETTKQELEDLGLRITDKIANDGISLSNLSDRLFDLVAQGKVTKERGVIIGGKITSKDVQEQVYKMITPKMTNKHLSEIADMAETAPKETATEQTLFGETETEKAAIIEKAKLLSDIRSKLVRDKNIFGNAAKNAERLEEAGNKIAIEESADISKEAATVLGVFDAIKNTTPEITQIINNTVKELKDEKSRKKRKELTESAYSRIKEAIPAAIKGVERSSVQRGEEVPKDTGVARAEKAEPKKVTKEKPTESEIELAQDLLSEIEAEKEKEPKFRKAKPADLNKGKKEVADVKEGTITTENPIKIYKGMFGKRNPDGTVRSAHPDVKGSFGAVDKKLATRYTKEEAPVEFDIPAGVTVEVVNVPKGQGVSKVRAAETKAINESDAQIVKLITVDARGREEQFIIKDRSLIEEAPTKLLAPNGKPSKLTPQQYEVVRTPEFKKWFGDWENDPKNASKVVDENGEPLVINRVNVPGGIRKRMGRTDKSAKGIYSSSIPMGEVKDIFDPENKGRYFTGFANVRNPLVMERTYYFDKKTKKAVEWSFDLKPEDYIEMKVISPQDFKLLKDLGYDGVWANKNDLPGVMIDEIIVFDKKQLKVEEVKDVVPAPRFRKAKPKKLKWTKTVEKSMASSPISKRDETLRKAVVDLVEGKLTMNEFREIQDRVSPTGPIETFFGAITEARAKRALRKTQAEKYGDFSQLKEGDFVEGRLDIPAYLAKNAWIDSIHEYSKATGRAGKPISYLPAMYFSGGKDGKVVFSTDPRDAINIASGAIPKSTIARVQGNYKKVPGEWNTMDEMGKAAEKFFEQEIFNNPEWRQMGMNPFRRSDFWDRENGRSVESADEVFMIGGLVYGKNIEYSTKSKLLEDQGIALEGAFGVSQIKYISVPNQITKEGLFKQSELDDIESKTPELYQEIIDRKTVNRDGKIKYTLNMVNPDGSKGGLKILEENHPDIYKRVKPLFTTFVGKGTSPLLDSEGNVVKFSKLPIDKEGVEARKTDETVSNVIDNMNSVELVNEGVEVGKPKTTDKKIDVKALNKRVAKPYEIVKWEDFEGLPFVFTITDALTTGNTKNPNTGNTIKNLYGGIGFTNSKGNLGENAWASVTPTVSGKYIANALEVYENNKEQLDRWWAENPEYNGLVPMAVVKMGPDGIVSNEALFRVANDNIKTHIPPANRKAALTALVGTVNARIAQLEEAVSKGRTLKSLADEKAGEKVEGGKATKKNIESYEKQIGQNKAILDVVKKNKINKIDGLLDTLMELPLGTRAIVSKNVFYGDFKAEKPGKPGKDVAIALLEGLDVDARKYINIKSLAEIIEEKSFSDIPDSHIVSIVGVDVLNPKINVTTKGKQILREDIKRFNKEGKKAEAKRLQEILDNAGKAIHPNYPFAVPGRSIGILESPVHMGDAFAEAYASALAIVTKNEAEQKAIKEASALKQGIPVQMGLPNKAFRGAIARTKSTEVDKLISFANRAFPSANVFTSPEAWERIMNRPNVRKRVVDGETVYGLTIQGDIYLNPKFKEFNTPIHEYGHLWGDMIEADNPALFNKGKELVKQTEAYKRNLKESEEVYGKGTREAEMDAVKETMAELIGDKGEKIANESVKQGWKEWLLGLWKYLQSKFPNLKSLTLKDIENLTLDQFLGGALRDIMSGKEITFKKSKNKSPMKRSAKGANENIFAENIEAALAKGASLEAIKEAYKRKIRQENVGNPAEISRLTVELEKAIAQFSKKPLVGKNTPTDLQDKLGIEFKDGNKLEVNRKTLSSWVNNTFKKGYSAGAKDERTKKAEINRVKKSIENQIASLLNTMVKAQGKGLISTQKSLAIVNKFRKTNLLNPDSVERFVSYFDNALTKAGYVKKIAEANDLRKKIRSKQKDEKVDVALTDVAKKFTKIDPNKLSDIDEYIEIANSVLNGVSKSKAGKDGINWRSAFDIDKVNNYLESKLKDQEEEALSRMEEKFMKTFGIDPEGKFTRQQMMEALKQIKDESLDRAKETKIRTEAVNVFNTYKAIIERMLSDKEDPFSFPKTGIPSVDRNTEKLITRFVNMDPKRLEITDLIQAVDALNNFLVNQTTGGLEKIVSRYEGATGVESLVLKKKIKAIPIRLGSKFIGRAVTEKISTIPVMLEQMFVGSRKALVVAETSGYSDISEGNAAALKNTEKVRDLYIDKFKNKKPNGEKFSSAANITERGMLAFMMRSTLDNNPDKIQDTFDRRKNLMKENIEVLKEAMGPEGSRNKTNEKLYDLYKEAYDKILEGSDNISEVQSKTDPINKQAVDFWVVEFNKILPNLQAVSTNIYNSELVLEKYYNPDIYRTLERTGGQQLEYDESKGSFNDLTSGIYEKKSPMMIRVKKPTRLPKERYISLEFDLNNIHAYEAALVDINTATGIQVYSGFVNNKAFFNKLIEDPRDRTLFRTRMEQYIRDIRNKNYINDPYGRKVVEWTDFISRVGTTQALGGLTQAPKQFIPVMVNTAINAGTLDLNVSTLFNPDVIEAIANSGMPIANRGIRSQTQIEGMRKQLRNLAAFEGNKAEKAVKNIQDFWLETFLKKPDVLAAQSSFITYYKKELKRLGYDISDIQWKDHKWNKKAARYAQQMVDRQQNVSDPEMMGTFLTSKETTNIFLRKVFIPFQSFVLNQKSRMYADLTVLNKGGSNEDKEAAARSLAGLLAELSIFYMLGIWFTELYEKAGKYIAGSYGFGEKEDEDEIVRKMNEEYDNRAWWMKTARKVSTSLTTDIISPFPLVDDPIKMGVNELIELTKPETSTPYEEYKKDLEKLSDPIGKEKAELALGYLKVQIESTRDIYPESYRLQMPVYEKLLKEYENNDTKKYSTTRKEAEKAMRDFQQGEIPFYLYERRTDELLNSLGVLGIGAKSFTKTFETFDMIDGEFEKEYMGTKNKMKIQDPDGNLPKLMMETGAIQIATAFFGGKEIASVADNVIKEVKKGAKTEGQIKTERIEEIKKYILEESGREDDVQDIYKEMLQLSKEIYSKPLIELTDKEFKRIDAMVDY